MTPLRALVIPCLAGFVLCLEPDRFPAHDTSLRLGIDSKGIVHARKGESVIRSASPRDNQVNKPKDAPLHIPPFQYATEESVIRRYNITRGILSADFGLALLSFWVIYSYWRSQTGMTMSIGLTKAPEIAVFAVYVLFSTSHVFLQRKAGKTGYTFLAATILVYILKTLVSLVMFLVKGDVRKGLSTLRKPGLTRFGAIPGCLLPIVPGGLFAGYDALSFLSLHSLSPATYQVMVCMRIVLVGLIWQVCFQRKLSSIQWMSFALILAAGLTKVIGHLDVTDGSFTLFGVGIMMAMNCMSAFACVSAEVLFKEMPMPTDLVNVVTYFWGILWLGTVLLFTQGADSLYHEVFSRSAWDKLMADPWMIGAICCLTAFGIVTAYLLRELSNIMKELASGIVIILSSILEWTVLRTSLDTPEVAGLIIAIIGIVIYSMAPLKK